MLADGQLESRLNWVVSLAILTSNNKPMILKGTERAKAMETSDAEIAEFMAFAGVVNDMNKVLKAARVLAPHSRVSCRLREGIWLR